MREAKRGSIKPEASNERNAKCESIMYQSAMRAQCNAARVLTNVCGDAAGAAKIWPISKPRRWHQRMRLE